MKASLLYGKTIDVLVFVGLIFFISLNVYWFFEQDEYVTKTPTQRVSEIKAGDNLYFSRYVCSNKILTIDAQRAFIRDDGYKASVRGVKYTNTAYCGYIFFSVKTPEFLPVGKYSYEAKLIYDLNPLKRVIRTLEPIKFEVVE